MRDLIRMADKNNGRIPSSIPGHYVRWSYANHIKERKLNRVSAPFRLANVKGDGFVLR